MTFQHATRQALLEAIGAARASVGKDLYARAWEPAAGAAGEGKGAVRMMQFNVLAEGLSSRADDVPPFPEKVKLKSDSGGFSNVPPDVFNYEVRKYLLLEEILRAEPDVLALEECDHFDDFFRPALALCGYAGEMCLKKRSPCVDFGYHPDGVALFWRAERFELVQVDKVVDVAGQAGQQCCVLVATLRCAATQAAYAVAATHLKSKATQENEALRALQITTLLGKLQEHVDASPGAHAVVLGDFNTAPHDELGIRAEAVPLVLAHPLRLTSTYPASLEYTTTKIRGDYVASHVIDYIFTSPRLRPVQLWGVPALAQLDPKVRLPCHEYPSDHVSLAADFVIDSPGA